MITVEDSLTEISNYVQYRDFSQQGAGRVLRYQEHYIYTENSTCRGGVMDSIPERKLEIRVGVRD